MPRDSGLRYSRLSALGLVAAAAGLPLVGGCAIRLPVFSKAPRQPYVAHWTPGLGCGQPLVRSIQEGAMGFGVDMRDSYALGITFPPEVMAQANLVFP